MLIGEVAHSTGLKVSTIRYYESRGVVPAPPRTPERYRDYDEADVDLLRFVERLRRLRVPLEDMAEVVSRRAEGTAPCDVIRESVAARVSTMGPEIERLRHLRADLVRFQAEADEIEDDWPLRCVCDVVDPDRLRYRVEVTLQYFDDCPGWRITARHLARLGVPVRYQRIETPDQAQEFGFRGSPTVLIEGSDPFDEPGMAVGLACRVFRTPHGIANIPTIDQLEQAVAAAAVPNRAVRP